MTSHSPVESGTYEKSIIISIGIQGNLPGNQRYLSGNLFRNGHVDTDVWSFISAIAREFHRGLLRLVEMETNSNNIFFLKEKIIHPPFTSVRMPSSYCGWRNRVGSDSIFIFWKSIYPYGKISSNFMRNHNFRQGKLAQVRGLGILWLGPGTLEKRRRRLMLREWRTAIQIEKNKVKIIFAKSL